MTRMATAMLAFAIVALAASLARADSRYEADRARDVDPDIEPPAVLTDYDPELKVLWARALARPEHDFQRLAADTIARAHREGMPDLQHTVPALRKALRDSGDHPIVRLAVARALVALDVNEAAAELAAEIPAAGLAYSQVVEPALVRWNYRPARAMWLQRLENDDERIGFVRLAIRNLADVKEASATPALLKLAQSRTAAASVRLDAGRALGRIESTGLLDASRKLATDKSPKRVVDRLVAAAMLASHGRDAADLLLELAVDGQPAVAAIALQRLLELDPQLTGGVINGVLASRDANVRHLGGRLLAAQPTADSVQKLAPLLDDPHPDVRRFVRRTLKKFAATAALSQPVRDAGLKMLAVESWRAQEQAALLLGRLDHEPAADRLVALLESPRPEVMVSSAWALKELAVKAKLPAMFAKAQREADTSRRLAPPRAGPIGNPVQRPGFDEQAAQLFEALGQMQYAPAAGLLKQFVPKSAPFVVENRAAAIWALGHIYAGKPQADLTSQFSSRLADINPTFPEFDSVREMAAVSLGRMKAKGGLPTLRRFLKDASGTRIGEACRWAIQQITGEKIPPPKPGRQGRSGWFLQPLGKSGPAQ